MAKPNHYLESQRRRIEENKKIMEKLNLSKLAHALKTPTFKKSPGKRKPRLPVDPSSLSLRRSNRVAEKPPTIYKEVPVKPLGRSRSYRSYQRRDLLNRVYASDEVRHFAIDRAGQIQAGLESDVPSFVKPMLQSHVTGGFWLVYIIRAYKLEDNAENQENEKNLDVTLLRRSSRRSKARTITA